MKLLQRCFVLLGLSLLLSCGGADTPTGMGGGAEVVDSGSPFGGGGSTGSGDGDDGGGTSSGGAPGSGGTGIGDPGSGGTGGVASVGSVDGLASVIVNGVRYDDSTATLNLEDVASLGLGMVVRVDGTLQSEGAGTAVVVESAPEIMGQVTSLDVAGKRAVVLGSNVEWSSVTAWIGLSEPASLAVGDNLWVHGLWNQNGLAATRIEKRASLTKHQVTGAVQGLDVTTRRFSLGGLVVDYSGAGFSKLTEAQLANGVIVRVRADGPPVAGVLSAKRVQGWLRSPVVNGGNVHLHGKIYDFSSLASFRILGTLIKADGNGVQFNADPASLGNGSDVQIRGRLSNGVLIAQKVTLISGANGGALTYSVAGSIGNFSSPASFKVKGQDVDASAAEVAFVNGTSGDLRNGKKVEVAASALLDGVLKASTVTFSISP